ncbi:MAG TPA: hypothetical protein VGK99_06085 [Acidobacteriota bacterium]|jgi:Zn finger protein HypA/HybF involved in hydrogenase expression
MDEIIRGSEKCHQCQVILPFGFRWKNGVQPVVDDQGDDVIRMEEGEIFLDCPSCGAQNFMKLEKQDDKVVGLRFDRFVW